MLVLDKVNTDIKITNNTKVNHIIVSFSDHYNLFHGILILPFQISLFSHHVHKATFSS